MQVHAPLYPIRAFAATNKLAEEHQGPAHKIQEPDNYFQYYHFIHCAFLHESGNSPSEFSRHFLMAIFSWQLLNQYL